MTRKKFISDYTERFRYYMLEGYSDSIAVEKMLGEMYDKFKRPTRKYYIKSCNNYLSDRVDDTPIDILVFGLITDIYKKYLSDSNVGDSADTVSEEVSLGTYKGKDMRFDTEEGRQAIRDCISNQEATISHLWKDNLSL